MSDKTDINQRNITKAQIYTRGLTAEHAVLWAFDFNIGLFETISDFKHYLSNKDEYIELASDDYKIRLKNSDKYGHVPSESSKEEAKKFTGFEAEYIEYEKDEYELYLKHLHHKKKLPDEALALVKQQSDYLNDDEFYQQQLEKEPQIDTMINLKKRLLCDIHNQLIYPKDSGLVLSQREISHRILTDDYEQKFDELYTKYGEEAHDRLPETSEVPLEEQTVSCASLYEWFCRNSIKVKSWENLKSFQKLPWSKLEPLKKRRDSKAGERSALVTYGAIIELLAELLVTPLVEQQLNRLIINGRVNISPFVKYLRKKKPQLIVQKRTLNDHIKDASDAFNDEK